MGFEKQKKKKNSPEQRMMHIIKIQNIILQIGELHTALPGYKENTEKNKADSMCIHVGALQKQQKKKCWHGFPVFVATTCSIFSHITVR